MFDVNDNIELKALFSMTYGMYIISTEFEGKLNGQIANTAVQVTAEPLCVSVCLNNCNLTTDMIRSSGKFSVSILERGAPMPFIGRFGFKSGRNIDKFAGINFITGETGAPMVTDWSVAAMDAETLSAFDLPSYTLFVGRVASARFLKDAEVLTYAYYHLIKKGKAPRTAPAFGLNQVK